MSKFLDLKELVSRIEPDFVKFYEKGNNSAGIRLRRGLKEVRDAAQVLRREIIEIKRKAKEMKNAG